MAKVNEILPGAPQTNVQRALPAMTGMSVLEADDNRTELGLRKPHRHLPPKYTAFGRGILVRSFAHAFAGNYKYDFGAARLRPAQEAQQGRMRGPLAEAVQIEAGFYRLAAARDPLLQSSPERRKRWRLFCRRRIITWHRERRKESFFAAGDWLGNLLRSAQGPDRTREAGPQRAFLFA
jgi:hypothetical protein